MDPLIFLVIAVTVPTLVVVLLHVPTSAYFLSILVGKLLIGEFDLAFNGLIRNLASIDAQQSNLILFGLPVVLTVIFTRGKSPKHKFLFNLFGGLMSSAVALYYLEPQLSIISRLDPSTSSLVFGYQKYVVGLALIYALITSWSVAYKFRTKKHKG